MASEGRHARRLTDLGYRRLPAGRSAHPIILSDFSDVAIYLGRDAVGASTRAPGKATSWRPRPSIKVHDVTIST
jgi:hypothetical protein